MGLSSSFVWEKAVSLSQKRRVCGRYPNRHFPCFLHDTSLILTRYSGGHLGSTQGQASVSPNCVHKPRVCLCNRASEGRTRVAARDSGILHRTAISQLPSQRLTWRLSRSTSVNYNFRSRLRRFIAPLAIAFHQDMVVANRSALAFIARNRHSWYKLSLIVRTYEAEEVFMSVTYCGQFRKVWGYCGDRVRAVSSRFHLQFRLLLRLWRTSKISALRCRAGVLLLRIAVRNSATYSWRPIFELSLAVSRPLLVGVRYDRRFF